MSIRETLRTDRCVFDRLAGELDRARLREGPDMRSHVCAALDVLEPALAAHCLVEDGALSASRGRKHAASKSAMLTAELQRDGIHSLIKDMRIIASDPARYRAGHLASLSFLLSKALREHLAHDAAALWADMEGLDAAAAAETVGALRRIEGLLGSI
ncbi:MAG: hypothetical protein HY928_14445 [Elusimicrobia bacterium]|nr:hypothetical protein [Elusimicrobiota bacterium]